MDFWENIEAYLTNDLSEADRRAFEQAMANDAALKQSVNEQRLIINALRQNKAVQRAADKQRLKGKLAAYVAELPDAPSVNVVDTEGGKIVSLDPDVKKTDYRLWWAAAASVGLLAVAGIWLLQPKPVPLQPSVVQTPTAPVLPIDTMKKGNVPKVEDKTKIADVPKATPQYQPPKKVENANQKPVEPPIIEDTKTKEQVFAIAEPLIVSERNAILDPTRGNSSSEISSEKQILLNALNALSAQKPNEALAFLQTVKEENKTKNYRYYRALAYLQLDKQKGKAELEILANDAVNLEPSFRNRIKELLKKLN